MDSNLGAPDIGQKARGAFGTNPEDGGQAIEELNHLAASALGDECHERAASICLAVIEARLDVTPVGMSSRFGGAGTAIEQLAECIELLPEKPLLDRLIGVWLEANISGYFSIKSSMRTYLWKYGEVWRERCALRCRERLESLDGEYGRTRLLDWLCGYHASRGEAEEAVPYALERFECSPTESNYRALIREAGKCGQLDRVDARVEPLVREHLPDILIERALETDEVAKAVDLWMEFSDHFRSGNCALELAEAAREAYPDVAVACYLDVVDGRLHRGGRRRYKEACQFLETVRDILNAGDYAGQWNLLVDDLSRTHDHRPAFLDEMAKSGFIEMSDEIRDRLTASRTKPTGPDWLPDEGVEDYLEKVAPAFLEKEWEDVIIEPSVRVYNCLRRSDLGTLRDVVRAIDNETICRINGFGPKSLDEVRAAICETLPDPSS